MPAIITSQFRLDVAKKVLRDIRTNNYYLTLGRSNPWPLNAESSEQPEPPYDNHQYSITDLYQNAHTMVSISESVGGTSSCGAILMAPLVQWQSGMMYRAYDPYDINFEAQSLGSYYVVTETNQVYICLKAPISNVSSSYNPESSIGGAVGAYKLEDGYIWQYLYTISTDLFEKFMTAEFFPVPYTAGYYHEDSSSGNLTTELQWSDATQIPGSSPVNFFTYANAISDRLLGEEDARVAYNQSDDAWNQLVVATAAQAFPNALFNIKINGLGLPVDATVWNEAPSDYPPIIIKDLAESSSTAQNIINPEKDLLIDKEFITHVTNSEGTNKITDIQIPSSLVAGGTSIFKLIDTNFKEPAVFLKTTHAGESSVYEQQFDAIAIKGPVGGFGADPRNELRAHYVGIYRSLQGIDASDKLPDQGSFRQLGIIKDVALNTSNHADTLRISKQMIFGSSIPASIVAGMQIKQTITTTSGGAIVNQAVGYVDEVISDVTAATYYISYHQTDDLGLQPFRPESATESVSWYTRSVLQEGGYGEQTLVSAVPVLSSIADSEVITDSGDVIFLENRHKVTRTNEQTERIKIVIEL
jgi:hypothetical protein